MATSFSAAAKHIDNRYEYGVSTNGARSDFRYIDSLVEPVGNLTEMENQSWKTGNVFPIEWRDERMTSGVSSGRYSYHRPSGVNIGYPNRAESDGRKYLSSNMYRYNGGVCETSAGHTDMETWKDDGDGKARTQKENWCQHTLCSNSFASTAAAGYASYNRYHGSTFEHDDTFFKYSGSPNVRQSFQCAQYGSIPPYSKPKSQTSPTMVKVSPGEYLRLRGADETWRAIAVDFFVPCECTCCVLTLFCIQDALAVVCPECLSVSPLEGVVLDGYDGGAGMGFTMESLAKWQDEIRMNLH
jgi:hypothetical protein